MDERRTVTGREIEAEILHCIVDAMLEAEVELHEASVDQWQRILVDSCRRRKTRGDSARLSAVTSC